MKTLYSYSQLREYGVNPLTGESCAFGMRILCDLSQAGEALVRDFMGMPEVPAGVRQFSENWNSHVNGDEKAVSSIMLTRQALFDLMRFALLTVDKFDVVITSPTTEQTGIHNGHPYFDKHVEFARKQPNYAVYLNPRGDGSSRNTHQFSGRTV